MFALGLIVYRIGVCSKENERKQKIWYSIWHCFNCCIVNTFKININMYHNKSAYSFVFIGAIKSY